MEKPDTYLTYVNTYYAVQEGLDRAVRSGEAGPGDELLLFSRAADPFLWDGESSADRSIYEGFSESFRERFGGATSSPDEGYDFARDWLAGLERKRFGTGLLAAFDAVADRAAFVRSYDAVRDQVILRREISEWYPQDEPVPPAPEGSGRAPLPDGVLSATAGDADAVAALVASADQGLRATVADYVRRQLRAATLLQWLLYADGSPVATAGLLLVDVPPTGAHPERTVGLVVLCGGSNDELARLLDTVRAQAADWGVDEVQEGSLAR